MKSFLLAIFAVTALAYGSGCRTMQGNQSCQDGQCAIGESCAGDNCQACKGGHPFGGHFRHSRPDNAFTSGPASATVTYPYYTTRGPRDFLVNNPPSIGN